MCNRFRATYNRHDIEEQFQAWDEIENVPRFNVAPTQPILTVIGDSGKRIATEMRWGLIPSWASTVSSGNFLARSESVTSTPSYRNLIRKNRCLIPADAFYEWQKIDGISQPFAFEVGDRELFAFAGLWDEWNSPSGIVQSCAILTTEPNSLLAEMHDRMPVIIRRVDYKQWLNPRTPLDQVLSLLKPYDSAAMSKYPVSTLLNNSQNESPAAAELIELQVPAQGSLF